MSKETIIPAGYRLSVTSWANDADNYKNEMVEGLTLDEVKFRVDFIKLFTSKNNRNDKRYR